MMTLSKLKSSKGFTLVEAMLVAVIIGGILMMSVRYYNTQTAASRMDRASAQMQEILNAGLSYYVSNAAWPPDIATLQTGSYLPANLRSPWATSYTVSSTTNPSLFSVSMPFPAGMTNSNISGRILAGRLPFGVSTTVGTTTTVTASVNLPMQNLNNAGAVNFAGLYRNGACVPAPVCPIDPNGTPMTPQIMVVPASVSGTNDTGTDNVYPLSSVTAFVTALSNVTAGAGAPGCETDTSGATPLCYQDTWNGATVPDGQYWRVCMQVITAKGPVVWDETTGMYGTVMALTRCQPNNEASGSSFDVWSST